ncbi:MAG TPA: chromosome segregation protein SMC [Epulopiscium sp.]|nr:chromosome segregation protein SMC [Candidatus Epulonipiscium sp.]
MYLKKVEIQGFKSFGDAVKLNIPPGITAVVGPNGCGKSNIADAMRWVLGEQSAKLLRGEKMQDVIFAGTQNRRGVGYAQVSMTIDNSEGELQIDYSEVVVTRRVYRSGESEYLINKSPCRLKDIHEVFMGTGVGKEGYSIIGQGQIDKILSSKPDDRRNLFEEAAGVYKYKLRKLEAEKKLDQKHENLVRVQDILTEVESRLETLEEQARKAKEYMSIRDVLKEIELTIFIAEADKIEKELLELTETYEALELDAAQNNESLKEIKETYDQIRVNLTSLQETSTSIQNEIMSIRMTIEQHQGNIKVNMEKIKSIDETAKRLKDDYEKRNSKSIEQKTEKELFESKQVEIQNKIKKQEVLLSVLENDYVSASNKVIKEEGRIESHKNKIYQGISKISSMENSIENGDTLKEQIEIRSAQIQASSRMLETNIAHQTARFQVLQKNQLESSEKYNDMVQEISRIQQTIESLKKEQGDNYRLHRTAEDLYHKSYSRHNVLLQMKNENEGFFASVKNILNLKSKNPTQWENIYGVVGKLITVPKELETAVDIALGNSVQHIVTKDEQTANLMIEHLKKYNLGRATFLPLSAVKGYSLGADANSIPKEAGVIGLANTLITYDKIYSNIIENLLGRVVIVDNMKNAIALAKKYRYRYRIVTLEGEVLNPGGSITGGHFSKTKDNIFSRDREVKELEEKINQSKRDLQHILEKEQSMAITSKEYAEALSIKHSEKADLEKYQMELKMEANSVQNTLKQYENEKVNLEIEKEEITKRSEKMLTDTHNYEELLKQTQLEVEEMEKESGIMQEELKEVKKQRELVGDQITELKVSLSSQKEILKSAKEQTERLERDMAYGINENQSYEERLKENQNLKQLFLEEIQVFKLNIKECNELLDVQNDKLKRTSSDIKTYNEQESEKRKTQDKMIETGTLLQNEIHRVEGKITKLALEKENIFGKAWEKYEVTYQTAKTVIETAVGTVPNQNVPELRKTANAYKSQIKGLGVINTGAIEEFDEIKERYEFMRGHEQDILSAEKTLLELIDNLTASMEVIFKDQFEKISKNFNTVFTELFGGGQAFLELSDTDDVLESGIEINVQPPGKKLQNMMLLSGGERALTAIAILFGILRLKPSPFAVLDEIEAALDDANVARFSNYLKGMGENMQFLIITHRKGTMAVADTIYGVTMEEQGVSKILSVQLDEATDYSDAKAT